MLLTSTHKAPQELVQLLIQEDREAVRGTELEGFPEEVAWS